MEFIQNLKAISLPEISIILFIFLQIILSIVLDTKFYKVGKWLTVLGLAISAALCTKVQIDPLVYGYKGAILSDNYTLFFKVIILISSFLIVFLTKRTITQRREFSFQFYALLLTAILGALSIVSANDFVTLFISMETLSISTIFLIAFDKGYPSKEAAFKYAITSVVASAVFLFGASYLYGITGSFNFSKIYEYFLEKNPDLLYSMSVIFIASGLTFKLGVTPFANWILDIYVGP